MYIAPTDPQTADLRAFLAEHAHPVDDLLVHADVSLPLARLATVWVGRRDCAPVAVAFAFPLWPENPAVGVKGRTRADEREMLELLIASGAMSHGYVICGLAQQALWGPAAGRREAHMTLEAATWRSRPTPSVRAATFEEVDAFYRTHQAAAWHPIQFETGPYVVAEVDGEIAAAAGTHFAYPALAQVGNVLTAPAYRGRGLAHATTAAVVEALFARGHGTVSLFVDVENAPARRVYEALGFATRREMAAFSWRAT